MRILFFALVVLIALMSPYWAALLFAVLYAFRYTAYELVVLGALLDALVGAGTFSLFYTLAFGGIFLLIEASKPFLTFYEKRT